MSAPAVRTIEEDEFGRWFAVTRTAMLGPPPDDAGLDQMRPKFDMDRCIVASDERGRMCGSAAAFATELTVPGGQVPAAGVTAVGVLPTHRRQGHLSRMMRAQLADVAERGEPVAVLVAAEYPIYRRYGYGPATEACGVAVDAAALGASGRAWMTPPSGRVELVDNDTFASLLPTVFERARSPGHISWRERDYQIVAGLASPVFGPDRANAPKVLWYDDEGELQGAVGYLVEDDWVRNRPNGTLRASPLLAATDEAERELVRFLTTVDWIAHVRLDVRPVDDPVPLWLQDGRAAVLVDRSDHVWARVLDVPAALASRRYQAPGSLVFEVSDAMGLAGGRFHLEVPDDGDGDADGSGSYAGVCTKTDSEPDVVVPIETLSAAYLGGLPWSRLAAGGWVDEHRPGAVAAASAMFTTPRAPWCPLTF